MNGKANVENYPKGQEKGYWLVNGLKRKVFLRVLNEKKMTEGV